MPIFGPDSDVTSRNFPTGAKAFIRSDHRQWRAVSAEYQGPAPWAVSTSCSEGSRNLARPGGSSECLGHVGFGSWPRENFKTFRARRRISERLRIMKLNCPAQIRLNAVLENCIFYI